jgi:type I restriction enzyme R subunit
MTGRRPVIFWSNGYEHWIWDDAGGYPPRRCQGSSPRTSWSSWSSGGRPGLPLAGAPIDKAIVERHYQTRASGRSASRSRPSSARRCWSWRPAPARPAR